MLDKINKVNAFDEIVTIAAAETDSEKKQRQSNDQLSEKTTIEQVHQYIRWRAMGKPYVTAASLTKISEEDALALESAEDIVIEIQAERDKIINDPFGALTDLIPVAIGVIKQKLEEGHLGAVQEVLKLIANSRKEDPETKVKNENTRPAATLTDRTKIEPFGRDLVNRVREGKSSEQVPPRKRRSPARDPKP